MEFHPMRFAGWRNSRKSRWWGSNTRMQFVTNQLLSLARLRGVQFVVSIDATDPFLVAAATGPAGLAELAGLASLVAEISIRQRIKRALVDLGAVDPDLSFTDHLQFGALAARLLS